MGSRQQKSHTANRRTGVGSTIGGVALGLVIAAMGAGFCWVLWRGYQNAMVTDDWVRTPCHIIQSEVDAFRPTPNSPPAYKFVVQYSYQFNGDTHTSTSHRRPRRNEETTKHKKKAESLIEKFPPGADSVCFVDPGNPAVAILKRDSKAVLYTIWFPGLFIIGGLGIAAGSLRRKP